MTEDQILRVLRQAAATPSFQIIDQVQFCRTVMSEHHLGEVELPISASVGHSLSIDRDAIDSIERLLITEAGFSKMGAAEVLSDALQKRHRGLFVPQFNSKDGFAKWLRQVANVVPLGELLHVAATLRNEYVHSPTDDWLKRQK